jgi:hypothetical protein
MNKSDVDLFIVILVNKVVSASRDDDVKGVVVVAYCMSFFII